MNKTEMADYVAEIENIPVAKARRIIDAVADGIRASCAMGGAFRWSGLGTFRPKIVKGRAYADPRGPNASGRATTTVDRLSLKFRPSSKAMD